MREHLTADEVEAARAWATSSTGCTCARVFDRDTERYVVVRHACPHCRAWERRLGQLGVSGQPREAAELKTGRRRYRRAA